MRPSSGYLPCSSSAVELQLPSQASLTAARPTLRPGVQGSPSCLSSVLPDRHAGTNLLTLHIPCGPPGPGRQDPVFPEQPAPWIQVIPGLCPSLAQTHEVGPERGQHGKQLSRRVSRAVQLGKVYFAKLLLSQGY